MSLFFSFDFIKYGHLGSLSTISYDHMLCASYDPKTIYEYIPFKFFLSVFYYITIQVTWATWASPSVNIPTKFLFFFISYNKAIHVTWAINQNLVVPRLSVNIPMKLVFFFFLISFNIVFQKTWTLHEAFMVLRPSVNMPFQILWFSVFFIFISSISYSVFPSFLFLFLVYYISQNFILLFN